MTCHHNLTNSAWATSLSCRTLSIRFVTVGGQRASVLLTASIVSAALAFVALTTVILCAWVETLEIFTKTVIWGWGWMVLDGSALRVLVVHNFTCTAAAAGFSVCTFGPHGRTACALCGALSWERCRVWCRSGSRVWSWRRTTGTRAGLALTVVGILVLTE